MTDYTHPMTVDGRLAAATEALEEATQALSDMKAMMSGRFAKMPKSTDPSLLQKEYISLLEAVQMGLIPSQRWFYNNVPADFPNGFKTTDSAQGRWYFKTVDLREYNESRMRPVI